MRAVRLDSYGGPEVLKVVEVADPVARSGEVLVRVKAAGINPGEIAVREGHMHGRFPATFPSGQGSDFAGVVEALGAGVSRFKTGDPVIGFSNTRSSHAELVAVPEAQLTAKPEEVSWEAAGGLFVAGTTAYAAVRAVAPKAGETVAISGAAGGVGVIASQLARHTGARVLGIASENNRAWLSDHGITPVTYGDGLETRLAADGPIHAFIDTYGQGYVELALAQGVPAARINTIIDFAAVEKHHVQAAGSAQAASAEVLAELAGLIATGKIDFPIAKTYPLSEVRAAFIELAKRHTHGKIVLIP